MTGEAFKTASEARDHKIAERRRRQAAQRAAEQAQAYEGCPFTHEQLAERLRQLRADFYARRAAREAAT